MAAAVDWDVAARAALSGTLVIKCPMTMHLKQLELFPHLSVKPLFRLKKGYFSIKEYFYLYTGALSKGPLALTHNIRLQVPRKQFRREAGS